MRLAKRYTALFTICISLFVALCNTSCEHRPLVDPSERDYIRVYFDEHIKNVSYGFYNDLPLETGYTTPKVLRIGLYNPTSGQQVYEGYLQHSGSDERGNYVDGYIPTIEGKYNLLINKFDGRSTFLKNELKYDEAQVYTKPISESIRKALASVRDVSELESGTILNQPDHFFVESEESKEFKETFAMDTLRNADGDYFTARSVVKTYYLQINVKGAEYVSSASGYLTGLAGSVYLANRALNEEDESCIFFQLQSNHTNKRAIVSQAYTTFNTFGKIPSTEGKLYIVFEFKTTSGAVQVEEIEVTDLFETDMVKNEQWIIIDKLIEIIPNVSDGGMAPTVDDWGTITGDITI